MFFFIYIFFSFAEETHPDRRWIALCWRVTWLVSQRTRSWTQTARPSMPITGEYAFLSEITQLLAVTTRHSRLISAGQLQRTWLNLLGIHKCTRIKVCSCACRVKPHHAIFGLTHGYFENSDQYHRPSTDLTSASTPILHDTLGAWWSHVSGARSFIK